MKKSFDLKSIYYPGRHLHGDLFVHGIECIALFDVGWDEYYGGMIRVAMEKNSGKQKFVLSDWVGRDRFLTDEEIEEMLANGVNKFARNVECKVSTIGHLFNIWNEPGISAYTYSTTVST